MKKGFAESHLLDTHIVNPLYTRRLGCNQMQQHTHVCFEYFSGNRMYLKYIHRLVVNYHHF